MKIEISEVAPQYFLRKTNDGREYLCDKNGESVSLTTESRESAIKLDSEKDQMISSYEGLGLSFSEACDAAGLEEAITDPERLFQTAKRMGMTDHEAHQANSNQQTRQSLTTEESNLYDAARRMGLSDAEAYSVARDGRTK